MVNDYHNTMNIQELRSAYSFLQFKKVRHKFTDDDKIELDTIIKYLRLKEGISSEKR